MHQLTLIWIIAVKDLKIEYRSKQAFLTTLFLTLLILAIFVFAFDPGSAATREASPGILWVALLFPGVIQLNRSFQSEVDEGTLYGLVLAPVDRGVIFLGKLLANWIFLMVVNLWLLVAFVVFFNFNFNSQLFWIALLILLSGVGFTAVGTLFAAMVSNVQTREMLLPILLFPILVPIILAAVNATQEVLVHGGMRHLFHSIQLLVAFDLIFVAAGFLVFDYVLGE